MHRRQIIRMDQGKPALPHQLIRPVPELCLHGRRQVLELSYGIDHRDHVAGILHQGAEPLFAGPDLRPPAYGAP